MRVLKMFPIGGVTVVLYHPYISGERAPFSKSFLPAAVFYGLTARHSRFDMMRAVFRGNGPCLLKDCFNRLPKADGKIYLTGGGFSQ